MPETASGLELKDDEMLHQKTMPIIASEAANARANDGFRNHVLEADRSEKSTTGS